MRTAVDSGSEEGGQLRLEDAPTVEGGGFHPPRRTVGPGEVWWQPGASVYHVETEPLRFDHVARYAVFGKVDEAVAAGARQPCARCSPLIAQRPSV